VSHRARLCACGIAIAAAALPRAAAAQSYLPQPQSYMLTTDAIDSRAVWVQPAGLVRRRESSVSVMASADRLNGPLGLSQYGVTLHSGGVAFGWQHDLVGTSDTVAGHYNISAWLIGMGFGGPRASIGGSFRMHRGDQTHANTGDIGGRMLAAKRIELGFVWRDIGSPKVLGDTIHTTLVPGAAIQLFKAHLQIGADWELVTGGWGTSAVRTGATVVLPKGIAVGARWETDGNFDTRTFSVALTWNGAASRVVGFDAMGHGGASDRLGLWGSAVQHPEQTRRRPNFGR
jgi:hypothetical protein